MPRDPEKSEQIEPDVLIRAYSVGLFPMADPETGAISWYTPDPRGILDFQNLKVSRSLAQTLKKGRFVVTVDRDFPAVIRSCRRPESWISEGIIQSYQGLYERGLAHSVECWCSEELVGGLYGVALGGAFFGESMFSAVRDASKVALVHLVRRLEERGYELLDVQFLTEHLASFGAREIGRDEYLDRLHSALEKRCSFA
jgi:leucyl/phenylalanyl-tRNA---protein transferase